MNATECWQKTQNDLKLRLTKATFNAWIADSHALKWLGNGQLAISVKNTYAKEWLDNHLKGVIEESLRQTCNLPEATITIEVKPETPLTHRPKQTITNNGAEPTNKAFNGFKKIKSHYTQIPNQLIDNLLPHLKPATVILVVTTFRQTVGKIISNNQRQTEWITTPKNTQTVCGLSETACRQAIREAIQLGLLECRNITDKERQKLLQENSLAATKKELVYALSPAWEEKLSH